MCYDTECISSDYVLQVQNLGFCFAEKLHTGYHLAQLNMGLGLFHKISVKVFLYLLCRNKEKIAPIGFLTLFYQQWLALTCLLAKALKKEREKGVPWDGSNK